MEHKFAFVLLLSIGSNFYCYWFLQINAFQNFDQQQHHHTMMVGYTNNDESSSFIAAYHQQQQTPPQNHHRQQNQQQRTTAPNLAPFSANELHRRIRRPPSPSNGAPVSVMLGFYLESLGNFRETQMSFDVDLYMYSSWKDPNLRHSGPGALMINDDALRKEFWLPDLYFANARQANFHEVTVPNFNLFIATDGTVAYSSRVTLTVACNLKLRDYPMDEQQCHIRVLSYAYIAKIVNVTWFRHQPIMYNPQIDLPEFDIDQIGAEYCDGTYRYAVTERAYKTDRFSCLMGNLYLKRRIGFNIVQSYIPTGLIVIISWVSFWIDRRAVPARVTLSFTTLLTMTTLGNGMRFVLPRVSYAKAIDYWFGGCMLFVFMALVEFALVNSYMRRSDKYEKLAQRIRRRTSVDLLARSPILSSELAHDHEQMLKMRRKSSALALVKKFDQKLDGQQTPGAVVRRKRGDNSSTVSEELSESRDEISNKNNNNHNASYDAENRNSSGGGSIGDGRRAAAAAVQRLRQQAVTATQNQGGKFVTTTTLPAAMPTMAMMNGSYYDNMNWSLIGRKGSVDPFKHEKSKSGGVNSVAFAVVDDLAAKRTKLDGNLTEDEFMVTDSGDGKKDVKQNDRLHPENAIKYLEAAQMLSRRALGIDKMSRILFPTMFVLFNCVYWSYYLLLRRRHRILAF